MNPGLLGYWVIEQRSCRAHKRQQVSVTAKPVKECRQKAVDLLVDHKNDSQANAWWRRLRPCSAQHLRQ